MQSTDELLLENEFVEGPVDSWLTSFIGWAESSDTYRCVSINRHSSAQQCEDVGKKVSVGREVIAWRVLFVCAKRH